MIDQRLLPAQTVYNEYSTVDEVAEAIRTMVIRGAPAIGIAAAYGYAIAARDAAKVHNRQAFHNRLAHDKELLAGTRPTAVNLFWALDRMDKKRAALEAETPADVAKALLEEATRIHAEDVAMCRAIGKHGGELLESGQKVLTHCNAGALATGDYGTALGVIRGAVEAGKSIAVYADETRPFLQGSRLTAWELQASNIPVTVITDNMAAKVLSEGNVARIVVGADRVAANGDAANKIGTLNLAILAKHYGIPFTVAIPRSTVDMSLASGQEIPIEQRNTREVTHIGDTQLVPEGVEVHNPAFDVTPAELIESIVTEVGVLRAPYTESIKAAMELDFDWQASG